MTNEFFTPIPEEAPGYSFVVNRRLGQIDEAMGRAETRINDDGSLDLGASDFARNHIVMNGGHIWVDERGLPRFSPTAPGRNEDGIILTGKDTTPPPPDTGGDITAPVNANPTVFVDLVGPIDTVSSLISVNDTRLLVGTGRLSGNAANSYVYTVDDPYDAANLAQSLGQRFVYRFANLGGGVVLAATGYLGRIFRSEDSGATWNFVGELKERGQYPEVRGLIHRGGGVVLAGCRNTGRIWRSSNGGDSWADTGFQQRSVRAVWDFTAGTGGRVHAACGGSTAAVYYTDDLGAVWETPTTQPNVGTDISAIEAFPEGRLVAGTSSGGRPTVFISDDGGVTYATRGQLPAPASGGAGRRTTDLLAIGKDRMLLATGSGGGRIYETTDTGETWVDRGSPGPGTSFILQLARHGENVYCVTTGGSRRMYQIIP